MVETLFDEKVCGRQDNFHITLGSAHKDSYPGDPSELEEKDWKNLGYNDSTIHIDVIFTSKREVTVTLKDGSEKVIYQDGQFTL